MKAAPLVILGLTCIGVVVAAPGLPNAAPPTRDLGSASSTVTGKPQVNALQSDEWGSGETTLARNADGHFYADVVANGVSSHMLVDTGASLIALTGSDAEAMGITWAAEDIRQVGEGANGPVYGFRVKLDSVQLGQVELSGVNALVVPEGLGISLLGQSFLSRAGTIEMSPEKMTLRGA